MSSRDRLTVASSDVASAPPEKEPREWQTLTDCALARTLVRFPPVCRDRTGARGLAG